jgi:hypothetical protein
MAGKLAHHHLRLFIVVPKIERLGFGLKLVALFFAASQVKDCPARRSRGGTGPRVYCANLHAWGRAFSNFSVRQIQHSKN